MSKLKFSPKGLMTAPSFEDLPPGAMQHADNVVIRQLGVISSPVEPQTFNSASVTLDLFNYRGIMPGTASLLLAATVDPGGTLPAGSYAAWVSGSTGYTNITLPTQLTGSRFDTGQFHAIALRNTFHFTSPAGMVSLDGEGSATTRLSGLPAPYAVRLVQLITDSTAQALQGLVNANYRAHFVSPDGTRFGAVSYPVNVTTTSISDPQLTVHWYSSYALTAGYTIRLYRTLSQSYVSVITAVDPGDICRLAQTYTLTATDIANGYATIRDSTPDTGLGEYLYSDPNQDSALGSHLPPPHATDIAFYKSYAFYIADKLASFKVETIPGVFGNLATVAERTHGIGQRPTTMSGSSGSAIFTSVDLRGLAVGQTIVLTPVYLSKVIGINTTTSALTASTNFGFTGAFAFEIWDRIEVNGHLQDIDSAPGFFNTLSSSLNTVIDIDQPVQTNTVTPLTGAVLIFESPYYGLSQGTQVSLRATNGQNYSPVLNDLTGALTYGSNDVRTNRVMWSGLDIPESVPAPNEMLVGSAQVIRLTPTRDCMYAWCTDGLWRIWGTQPPWQCTQVDATLQLAARNAVAVHKDVVYAYTNRGLVEVNSSGNINEMTSLPLSDLCPGQPFYDDWTPEVCVDIAAQEVHLTFRTGDSRQPNPTPFTVVYNTTTKAYTAFKDSRIAEVWCQFTGGIGATVFASEVSASAGFKLLKYAPEDVVGNVVGPNHLQAARMSNPVVEFRPLFTDDGVDTAIDWHNVTVVMSGGMPGQTLNTQFVTSSTGAATQPISQSIAVDTYSVHQRVRVPIDRNASTAPTLSPRFTWEPGTGSLSLTGFSAEYDTAGDETWER
jgi:hypothetical protein